LQRPLNAAVNGQLHVPFPATGLLKSRTITTQSIFRKVRNPLQNEFSGECELVLPLSSYSISRFMSVIQ